MSVIECNGSSSGGQENCPGVRELDVVEEIALRRYIEHVVTFVFAVRQDELRNLTRGRANVAFARQVAMYLAHVSCSISLTGVGRIFERDRTTVAHACSIIEDNRDNQSLDLALDFMDFILRDH